MNPTFFASPAHTAGQARADYWNTSSYQSATQTKNPAVAYFNGYVKAAQSQTANTVVLQECTFGQAFSQWYPSDNYAAPIVAAAKLALYPTATTPATLTTENKPFRYKLLLYSGSATDVTAFDPATIATLFTQADCDAIYAQIATLKTAIAASPWPRCSLPSPSSPTWPNPTWASQSCPPASSSSTRKLTPAPRWTRHSRRPSPSIARC